jgi:hypothetical protein
MFGSSLPPVICWRAHVLFTLFVFVLCIVVSNSGCVVFLFYLSSIRRYVVSFSGLSIFLSPLPFTFTIRYIWIEMNYLSICSTRLVYIWKCNNFGLMFNTIKIVFPFRLGMTCMYLFHTLAMILYYIVLPTSKPLTSENIIICPFNSPDVANTLLVFTTWRNWQNHFPM